ncbi:hypothetical protein BS47DRAFT_1342548, partial [Hydnum rufescens UP504]
MFRRNGANVIGVLNRYDLAIDINKPSSTSLEQIGVRHLMPSISSRAFSCPSCM